MLAHVGLRTLKGVFSAEPSIGLEVNWYDIAKDGLMYIRCVGSSNESTAFKEDAPYSAVKIVEG